MDSVEPLICGRKLAVLLVITGAVWVSDFCREPLIRLVDVPTADYRQECRQENGEPPKLLMSYFGYSGILLMEEWLKLETGEQFFTAVTPYSDGTMGLTWKGFLLRFLITEVSPTSYGSLEELQTWKTWWACTVTIAGITKTLLLASFYFSVGTLLFYWTEDGREFFGVFAWIFSLLAIPFILWILLVPQLVRPLLSAVFGFLASIFPGPLSDLLEPRMTYEWILYHLGVTVLGTLIMLLALPVLLLHGLFV
jgi:hypothetical protein